MVKKRKRRLRPEQRKRKLIVNLVVLFAVAMFLYAGFNLFLIFSEYKQGSSEYVSLEKIVISIETPSSSDSEEAVFRVDFDKLQEMNPDIRAWIRFENPSKISYPVVAGIDNDIYLHRTFEGQYNAAGTIFIDVANAGDFYDHNTFIHGHNMKNGSMFGQLRKYRDQSFCEENPYFYIYTPDGREIKYQIFAVCIVKDTSDSFDKWFEDDSDFMDYINYEKRIALYPTDVEVEEGDTIVSLSTCTNVSDDERLLVQGVKISEKMIEE